MREHSSPLGDLPSRSASDNQAAAGRRDEPLAEARRDVLDDDDAIRIEDLAPREDPTGGRKFSPE